MRSCKINVHSSAANCRKQGCLQRKSINRRGVNKWVCVNFQKKICNQEGGTLRGGRYFFVNKLKFRFYVCLMTLYTLYISKYMFLLLFFRKTFPCTHLYPFDPTPYLLGYFTTNQYIRFFIFKILT